MNTVYALESVSFRSWLLSVPVDSLISICSLSACIEGHHSRQYLIVIHYSYIFIGLFCKYASCLLLSNSQLLNSAVFSVVLLEMLIELLNRSQYVVLYIEWRGCKTFQK